MRSRRDRSDRERLAERLRARLRRHGLQRLEMSLIVICTGGAGFFASAGLLTIGVTSMAVRYALALVGAYVVFLLLIRLWVELHRRGVELNPDLLDIADLG